MNTATARPRKLSSTLRAYADLLQNKPSAAPRINPDPRFHHRTGGKRGNTLRRNYSLVHHPANRNLTASQKAAALS